MAQNRSWMAWIFVPIALVGLAIPGMQLFMSVTAPVLHPNPQAIPSVMDVAPASEFIPAAERARQIVRAALSEENLPGLSVAVGIGDDIVWTEGFGFADLDSRLAVTPGHRFRIGTASAMLTSAAAGLLLEEGRLALDAEIQTYVPAFRKKQWPVTLRELMGHTAGLISDSGDEGPLLTNHCESPAEALPHFADSSLLFEPGTRYRHSNYGWILVSAAIESVSARPFLTFMEERVFNPLGMRDTLPDSPPVEPDDEFPIFNLIREKLFGPRNGQDKSPDAAEKPVPKLVTSYFPRFSADPNYGLHLMRALDLSCYAGSSVFLSTPSDMVRFGIAVQTGRLLKSATIELLQMPQRLASGADSGYGLGWERETVTWAGKQTDVTGHSGELLGGLSSSFVMLPEDGIAVAVMSNISYAETFPLALKIAEAFAPTAAPAAR